MMPIRVLPFLSLSLSFTVPATQDDSYQYLHRGEYIMERPAQESSSSSSIVIVYGWDAEDPVKVRSQPKVSFPP